MYVCMYVYNMYTADFDVLETLGSGSFSTVFKVSKQARGQGRGKERK
jgi:hypothetical protein